MTHTHCNMNITNVTICVGTFRDSRYGIYFILQMYSYICVWQVQNLACKMEACIGTVMWNLPYMFVKTVFYVSLSSQNWVDDHDEVRKASYQETYERTFGLLT